SSASTKLIHGGLRYLEHYELRLVRESLLEREVLWALAPHIIWPLRFVLPYQKGLRPAWLLRLGLFLYDHIGGRKRLPPTRVLDMQSDQAARPLKPLFTKAFEYSDCWVDDARLVVLNARDAADRGAEIMTRTRVVSARRGEGAWSVTTEDAATGERRLVRARLLVNAAGPWIDAVLETTLGGNAHRNVRLVKGSHIVVRRKYDDPRAYFFQNADGRIFFAIPYQDAFTLIGTTDEDFSGDPQAVRISDAEIDYLCTAASAYFAEPVRRDDIVWAYSGVRPLYDDGASKAQEATRDYVLKTEGSDDEPRLVNVFGGKITTYRRLSEAVLDRIAQALGPRGRAWTGSTPLPGGDFGVTGYEDQVGALSRDYPFLPVALTRRYVRLYGTRARMILGEARSMADMGADFGSGLHAAEVRYLMEAEWARTAEDVLWRRTKLGLHIRRPEALEAIDRFMQAARRPVVAGPGARASKA
ncbi:MAG: glycerol-3-phosphate dehydrogenase, partial [Pararhizobium sp.]